MVEIQLGNENNGFDENEFWNRENEQFLKVINNEVYTIRIPNHPKVQVLQSKFYPQTPTYAISVEVFEGNSWEKRLLKINNQTLKRIVKNNFGNEIKIKRVGTGFQCKYELVHEE